MDELEYKTLKEFTYNDGENQYYASMSSRGDVFEVVTQINGDKPFHSERPNYSAAIRVFKDFILTSNVCVGLFAQN